MKKRKFILPLLFMGLIIIMGAITFFAPGRTYSENEKRILADFPKITWDSIKSGEFQDGFETYISDHLAGREFFVGVNAYWDKLLGKNALKDIYSADDGYLVNAPKDISGGSFRKNMENFQNFTQKTGIDSTLMIIPSAGYIMEDKLPSFHKKYNDDELFKLASELTPSVRFFDTRGRLLNKYNEGAQVYYRTDHHLTSEGSYALYREYCTLKGMDYPQKEEYSISTYGGFYGTTYSGSGYFLNRDDSIEIWDKGTKVTVTLEEKDSKKADSMFFKEHLDSMDMYPVYLDGNHSYVKIENPESEGGNLLIIRDSYAQNMAPFLAHNYKNIYMLDMRYYRNFMSKFLEENEIDEILYLYGIDTLLTDESSNWLFF